MNNKTASRVALITEAIRLRVERRASMMDVVRRVGLPQTTVHRILAPYPLTEEENRAHLRAAAAHPRPSRRRDPKEIHERKKANQRNWYGKNKRKQREWVKKRQRRITEAVRAMRVKCAKCPETHPACLDFHHRDSGQKDFTIGAALQNGWALGRILKEIAKCDVLCSNCHRKHHWEEKHGVAQRTERLSSKESDAG